MSSSLWDPIASNATKDPVVAAASDIALFKDQHSLSDVSTHSAFKFRPNINLTEIRESNTILRLSPPLTPPLGLRMNMSATTTNVTLSNMDIDTPGSCPHCSSSKCCNQQWPLRDLPVDVKSAGALAMGSYTWCGSIIYIAVAASPNESQATIDQRRDVLIQRLKEVTTQLESMGNVGTPNEGLGNSEMPMKTAPSLAPPRALSPPDEASLTPLLSPSPLRFPSPPALILAQISEATRSLPGTPPPVSPGARSPPDEVYLAPPRAPLTPPLRALSPPLDISLAPLRIPTPPGELL